MPTRNEQGGFFIDYSERRDYKDMHFALTLYKKENHSRQFYMPPNSFIYNQSR